VSIEEPRRPGASENVPPLGEVDEIIAILLNRYHPGKHHEDIRPRLGDPVFHDLVASLMASARLLHMRAGGPERGREAWRLFLAIELERIGGPWPYGGGMPLSDSGR
jgi:hypothetical protein